MQPVHYILIAAAALLLFAFAKKRPRDTPEQPSILTQSAQAAHDGALVIDVRTPDEFANGHIDGAINIPFDQTAQRLNDLPSDKTAPIVLYCRSGRRSSVAARTLAQHGYTNILDAGAITSLQRALNAESP